MTIPIPAHASATLGESFVTIKDVSHRYAAHGAARPALASVTLRIAAGAFFSLIGPSGCGKSTLLRIVAGLLEPTTGAVQIAGDSPDAARRAKTIGFVSQDPALLPWRTVAANVGLLTEVGGRRAPEHRIGALLTLVGLEQFADYYPHQLSGGMRQRVALARALALEPSLLLMDEPFGALDEITRTELRYELLRICERLGTTVLFVTHSIAEAVLLSDQVAVMSGQPGRIRSVQAIALSRPRLPEVEDTAAFLDHARRLRAFLRED